MTGRLSSSEPSFTIIIPVFNEERSVRLVVDQVCSYYPQAELIVVDDGSTDATASMLEDTSVRVLRHEYNRGYGAALKTGIAAAMREVIVTIDADGEHMPEDIGILIGALPGVDMAVGSRRGGGFPGMIKVLGRMVFVWISCFLASARIPDINSGLRAFRKKSVMKYLHMFPDSFSFHTTSTMAILFSGGCIKYIPVNICPRIGVSKVRLRDGLISLRYVIMLAAKFRPFRVWTGIWGVLIVILCGILIVVSLPNMIKVLVMIGLISTGVISERLSQDKKMTEKILKVNKFV